MDFSITIECNVMDVGVGGPETNPLQIPKDSCTDQFTHQVTESELASVLSK